MQANYLSDLTFVSGMFEKIYSDVEVVRNRAVAKTETLRVTTEQQIGMEVFNFSS